MKTAGEILKESKKIVIKLGSNTISDATGKVNRDVMKGIVEQVVRLIDDGKRVIIVSSGAGSCGVAAIDKWHRKSDINYKQALCAIGQVELMNAYKDLFGVHGYHVGQLLLTKEDFEDHHRELNIRNALFTLVDEGVVPIVNENDSVSVDEIKIGDNDTLSALTAVLWAADLLILMSDIDGVYDRDPNANPDATLIEYIEDPKAIGGEIETEGKSTFGTGGIVTKLHAAGIAGEYGIPMILTNSRKADIIGKLIRGEERATVFAGKQPGV